MAAALFMFYLGQNYVFFVSHVHYRVFESTNYKHENTGAGHNFMRANAKCESIPNPPYLSGSMTYEDDQTAKFHSNFARIHFPVSKIFFAFIFTSNFPDDVMITSPQQVSI